MKKLLAKMLTLVCAAMLVAVCAFALTACDNGEKFTYSETKIEVAQEGGYINDTVEMLKTTYDSMYKNSTIILTDTKLTWKILDNTSILSVEKDGEKYILSGEYVEQMTQVFGGLVSGDYLYGLKTDAGFDLVMDMGEGLGGIKIIISFTK